MLRGIVESGCRATVKRGAFRRRKGGRICEEWLVLEGGKRKVRTDPRRSCVSREQDKLPAELTPPEDPEKSSQSDFLLYLDALGEKR